MSASTNKHKLVAIANPSSRHAESYRTLRANIQFASRDRKLKVVLVTSSKPGEGKTTTAGNLAVLYAQLGKKTLLIDANLRKPDLHRYFNVANRFGLTNVLSEEAILEHAVTANVYPNLTLMTSGSPTAFPSEMLASERFAQLMATLRELYDIIIVDAPSSLGTADSQQIATMCDGSVLVVRRGASRRGEAHEAVAKLDHVHAGVIGVVLNR
ncbi:CpsD/CapB family tyrosine-protein kinase [Cohnella soli]|uniref:non-specific protein-tyrosine kinase n=1 Tax=Cohnella soli TaxID=425005 RepID=A0ABW0HXL2_9BACL